MLVTETENSFKT